MLRTTLQCANFLAKTNKSRHRSIHSKSRWGLEMMLTSRLATVRAPLRDGTGIDFHAR